MSHAIRGLWKLIEVKLTGMDKGEAGIGRQGADETAESTVIYEPRNEQE